MECAPRRLAPSLDKKGVLCQCLHKGHYATLSASSFPSACQATAVLLYEPVVNVNLPEWHVFAQWHSGLAAWIERIVGKQLCRPGS